MQLKHRTVTDQPVDDEKKMYFKDGKGAVDHNPDFEIQVQMAREIMKKHQKGSHELAMK